MPGSIAQNPVQAERWELPADKQSEHPLPATDCATPFDIEELVGAHSAELYRYAYRLSGNQADAEDLTQQTFMIAQQKSHQVRENAKIRAWLFTVLRSCYLKGLRKQSPLGEAALELPLCEIPEQTSAQPLDEEALQAALNDLPDSFKLVIVMYYFEQCSYKEIAEKLDLPPGTVMSRLARAKEHLRRRLLEAAPDISLNHGSSNSSHQEGEK